MKHPGQISIGTTLKGGSNFARRQHRSISGTHMRIEILRLALGVFIRSLSRRWRNDSDQAAIIQGVFRASFKELSLRFEDSPWEAHTCQRI